MSEKPTYEELAQRVRELEAAESGRKVAEEALKVSKERLHLALDAANAGIWEWDLRTNENFWSEELFKVYGLKPHSCKPSYESWRESIHPEDREKAEQAVQAAAQGGTELNAEWRVNSQDGGERWLMSRARPVFDDHGVGVRYIGIVIDITERKQAEEALRESEEKFRSLYDSMSEGMALHQLIYDSTGKAVNYVLLSMNPACEAILDLKAAKVLGHKVTQTYGTVEAPYLDVYAKVVRTGQPAKFDTYFEPMRKFFRIIVFSPAKDQFATVFEDITARKREEKELEELHAQLAQAQKMESVGRLAGGVAHDFNNMLSVILGHSEMALEQLDADQPITADLQEIQKAAQRSAAITRQLLAFARKQTVTPKVLDLNETVEALLRMLRRLIGEDIDLRWQPARNLGPVKIDPSQIDQILVNLCVNARDAISGTGTLTIETGNAAFDEDDCTHHADSAPGDYVLLSVSDTGCGMDRQILAHLFEPFFTTKDVDKGTGLGLATVYGIVKQNNGFINVDSEPGHGTTFKIYFPMYRTKADAFPERGKDRSAKRGHETILLVEDESAILRMTQMMLEKLGYQVIPAGTPGEAIHLAQEYVGEIHLLITDVIMPEMNGRDLARTILSLYPNLKRLFMSGYTADVIAHQGVLDGSVKFIQKPFTRETLGAKVRESLDKE
jgi:PAS domain S-box-containing protein